MSFNAVFGCLKEVFPQVDFRILKAIAIEHPFDADAAVLDVINEFPNFATQSFLSAVSPTQVQSPEALPVTAQHQDKGKLLMHQQVIKEAEFEPLPEPENAAVDDDSKNDHTSGISHDNPTLLEQVNSFPNGPVPSDAEISTGSEELISDGKGMNFDVQVGLQQSASGITTLSMPEKDVMNGTLVNAFPDWKSLFVHVNCDSDLVLHDTRDNVEPFAVDSSFPEHSLDAHLCDVPCSDPLLADDNLQATGPSDHTSEKECSPREMVDIEETTTDSVCNTDVLEEIIEDAKNNKKTLFSAMESVISMMREVEVQEKEVDIVQEEASRGGLDIMVKVEELKQMLAHAKDRNDMHAGEVYGEKAILATEARELQSRLLNLSDERDKSLAILNEMQETLEERLDAAAEARRLAEQDKLEKEECARKALAEQEAEMEKVVQESKILQQEADENSKLREFLMDRGRIVDMLQGEISVICQDVRLLKEKFDERVPLTQSVSSSQTSCILASSGVALDLVSERLELLKSPEKVSPAPSVDGLSPKSILEQERSKADRKELMDDGWDVFDIGFGV